MSPLQHAVNVLKQGGIIAYPTEAVYGFGCDPFNQQAVMRLLQIKHRSVDKGLIIIAANWQQVQALAKPLTKSQLDAAFATWPGPTTWVFPAATTTPNWLTGKHSSIAIRITAHPTAKELCQLFAGPIVSTSANIEGKNPGRDYQTVYQQFAGQVDYIIDAAVGNLPNPTMIKDALTGHVIRNSKQP